MIMSRSLNDQFIHQCIFHASHQLILLLDKLGIYTGLPKYIPKLSHLCCTCIIYKGPHLTCHNNVSTENLDSRTSFHMDSRFFNNVSCLLFTSYLNIVDATTSQNFIYPTISKRPTLQLINPFIHFSLHHVYKWSIFQVDEFGELSRSVYFMQIFIDHDVIVETTGGYASSINGNIKLTHQRKITWSAFNSFPMNTVMN